MLHYVKVFLHSLADNRKHFYMIHSSMYFIYTLALHLIIYTFDLRNKRGINNQLICTESLCM